MKRVVHLLLTLGIILAAGSIPVHAQSQATITCDGEDISIQTDAATDLYNENIDEIPSYLRGLVASNTTEIHVENADPEYYTVTTNDDREVTDVRFGETDSPDVTVTTDEATACSVYQSDDPVATARDEYSNDDITIESTGVVNKVKVSVVDTVVDLADMF